MIRLGIVGCGEHAEVGHAISLARYLAAHPGEIELTTACDVQLGRAQRFCQRYGFKNAFVSIEDMVGSVKLDGCVMVVPPGQISAVGVRVLQMGIPCVLEKPLGTSLHEVALLLDTAKATGTRNMVSVNRRFMPFLNRGLDWTRSVGPLRYVRCTMTRHARSEPDFLWTTAIHAVDTLRFIAGDVADYGLRTMSGSSSWHAIDLKFNSGTYGRIDILPTTGSVEEVYDLYGENFQATVTSPFGRERSVRCFRDKQIVLEETANDLPEDVLSGFYAEAEEFIRALRDGDTPHPAVEDVAPSVTLCLEMAKHQEGIT